jgi:hypothetical protein
MSGGSAVHTTGTSDQHRKYWGGVGNIYKVARVVLKTYIYHMRTCGPFLKRFGINISILCRISYAKSEKDPTSGCREQEAAVVGGGGAHTWCTGTNDPFIKWLDLNIRKIC